MYRLIMVPTDGSDLSRHAIPLALAVARPAKAVIHLVSVLDETVIAPIYGVPVAVSGTPGGLLFPADPTPEMWQARRDTHRSALREFAGRLAADSGVTVTTAVEEGNVAETLRDHAESQHADLIIMATHGRSGLARAILGSVADALIRSSPCPVLLARPHGDLPRDGEAASITHVLVPLDGTAESDTIVPRAADLAAATGARSTLMYVSNPEILSGVAAPEALLDPVAMQRSEEAEHAHLARMAELFRTHAGDAAGTVATTLLRERVATEAVIDYAGTHAVDLIAMTTHARHGLARLMLGSTATSVLKKTKLPLLLARPTMAA